MSVDENAAQADRRPDRFAARAVPAPAPAAAWMLGTWVLLFGALLGAGRLVADGTPGDAAAGADLDVVRWFVEQRTPTWTTVASVVTLLGGTITVIALGLVAAAVAFALTRHWRPVVFLAVVMAGELTLFLAVGSIVERTRPPVAHLGRLLPPTSSFPSGHVAAAICLYGAIAVLVLTRILAWWRWAVLAAAVVIAAAVAMSRFYFGVHYPTDALGSVLLAVPWLTAAWYVVLRPAADRAQAPDQAGSTGAISAAESGP
jgi:undecaprenyl-diphosphatase